MTDARDLLTRFPAQRVVVVGDVMLDHFVIGSVDRISPEAPVPVVKHVEDEYRLGGAANVAANLRALGCAVDIVGIIGPDAEGTRLRKMLVEDGIGVSGLVVDRARCTTRKTRIVTTRNQQVARIDYEADVEADGPVASELGDQVARLALEATAILISDYMKGAISRDVAKAAIAAGRTRKIPVTVDPKVPHASYYSGATLTTPNHHEAEAISHMRVRDDAGVSACAAKVREVTGCENVLITRGEHGIWLQSARGDSAFPAEAREVADVTGAGDTVIATLTLALAAGASLEDAARLANRAAGLVVGRFGPATVTAAELVDPHRSSEDQKLSG